MGGAGGGASRSSSQTTVPKFQRKYLTDLYGRAQADIANNPMEMYGGPMVADQDPATLGYYDKALSYADQGNAGLNQAAGYNSDVLSGKYMSPESNPYLRDTYDQASRAVTENYRDAVLPAVTSRFALAGGAGSGGYVGARNRADQSLARSLGDVATNIYGGAYESERGRMDSARGFAPTLADDETNRLGLRQGVGQQKEQYQQSLIDELISRFDFAQNEPAQRLSRYASLLGNPITLSNSKSKAWNAQFGIGGSLPGL
jgi:hypothetical protein